MSNIERRDLAHGIQIMWATPLSGYGHAADEQPLPYIHHASGELTSRFGGEEQNPACGIETIPLPYGKISHWPWRQRLFNLPRRRINIYWRNIFRSRSNPLGKFYFLEQLDFTGNENGFKGQSPILDFSRLFLIGKNTIRVTDQVVFKAQIHFDEFYACPWADFEPTTARYNCEITTSLAPNFSRPMHSSTGSANFRAHKLIDVTFKNNQVLTWQYLYKIN